MTPTTFASAPAHDLDAHGHFDDDFGGGVVLEIGQPADDEIKALEAAIRQQYLMRVHGFQIHRNGKGLVLNGRTKTWHGKQLILNSVMRAIDLPIVANNISVG